MIRTADAEWKGNLKEGSGKMKLGSGAFEGQYSFKSRFENGTGTNPEELIAAAHAGCFSMALSNNLATAGHTPERVHTVANVDFGRDDKGAGNPEDRARQRSEGARPRRRQAAGDRQEGQGRLPDFARARRGADDYAFDQARLTRHQS